MFAFIGISDSVLGGSGDGLQCCLEAQVRELADEALELGFPRAVVEVGRAEVGVRHAILEHVVDGGQDRRGDGANGFLRAALGLKAEKLGAVVACPWHAWPPMRTERAW